MTGQSTFIDQENKKTYTGVKYDELGNSTGAVYTRPAVVEFANGIDKPSVNALEKKYGLKVAVAMLQTSALDKGRMRYREIYIHSKLLLVDDSFFSLGSANLNQRSMAVDSEINLATNDARSASPGEIHQAFSEWGKLMKTNSKRKINSQLMKGFLLPLQDNRSATLRLG
jgi:phosphatidylserine/phosphatidylglycerophosphate/cardiolipin synthase-like enzyme